MKLLKTTFSLFAFLLCIGAQTLLANDDLADLYYADAKKMMAGNNKKNMAKAIYLLKKARNIYSKGEMTDEREENLTRISSDLYWQYKMKPARMSPYHPNGNDMSKYRKALAELNKKSAKPEGQAESEAPEKMDTPEGSTDPSSTPENKKMSELFDDKAEKTSEPEVQSDRKQVDKVDFDPFLELESQKGELPPIYQQAQDYKESHPKDYNNQYLLFGQVMNEVENFNILENVISIQSGLREKISTDRMAYRKRWFSEIKKLRSDFDNKDYNRVMDRLTRFQLQNKSLKTNLVDQEYFKGFFKEVRILNYCKKNLFNHTFEETSLPADGLVIGFEGNLLEVSDSKLLAYNSLIDKRISFNWENIEIKGLVNASIYSLDEKDPKKMMIKALALKASGQLIDAYDVLRDLRSSHPEMSSINQVLQECELLYLSVHGKPIESLIQKISDSLKGGSKGDSVMKDIVQAKRMLDHPFLFTYDHQIKYLVKKYLPKKI